MSGDVRPRQGGPKSLYCYTCDEWVANTANAEMRSEGAWAHSHVCKPPTPAGAPAAGAATPDFCPRCGSPFKAGFCGTCDLEQAKAAEWTCAATPGDASRNDALRVLSAKWHDRAATVESFAWDQAAVLRQCATELTAAFAQGGTENG